MIYVLFALILFCLSVMTHIFFCRRTTRPGLQAKAYLGIAFLFLVIDALAVAWIEPSVFAPSVWGLPFKMSSGIIFILLVPIYLCFYVLTQLTSPSKKILLTISQHEGLAYDGIVASIQKEDFIMTRLNDLCTSGCVRHVNGHYILTSEGKKIAAILNLMQLILGRNVGG